MCFTFIGFANGTFCAIWIHTSSSATMFNAFIGF